ncbi:MAG: PepSY domain-containing protein [Paraclostridium sp.]
MKRKIVALLSIVSIMAVGCSKENKDVNNTNTNKNTKVEQVEFITEEKVNKIVLEDTPNGKIIEFSLDENDVKPNYDVSVSDGKTTYEYEIDAVNGDILKKETKTENTNIDDKDLIGEEKAKEIALAKVPNGKVIGISLDKDDNIVNYDITISDNEYEYEYEIHAKDGSIIAESKEKIAK